MFYCPKNRNPPLFYYPKNRNPPLFLFPKFHLLNIFIHRRAVVSVGNAHGRRVVFLDMRNTRQEENVSFWQKVEMSQYGAST